MAGLDLVALVDAVRSSLSNISAPLLLGGLALVLLLRSGLAKRLGAVLENLFFTNWQLGLLSATGIVLSAASGWTTWDGMKNFTGEPILSAMVTFGIQGVMLIVAWLIGESFATGMTQQAPNGVASGDRSSLKVALGATLLGIAMAAVAFAVQFGSAKSSEVDKAQALTLLYWAAGALVAVGLFVVASKAHTFRAYFDATRVIARTAVLWVMFLACMATSVFFSFDSLFSTIFPQSERARAAELRAQNQVAGVVSDIGNMITQRQASEAEALFAAKGWQEYDQHLSRLARAANESQGAIEKYFNDQIETRKTAVQQQQERIATAQSSQAGLSQKQIALREELTRLEAERPSLVSAFAEKKSVVEEKQKAFDAKRVEAMAEERGVEGTGKVGQGPQFRARKAEEAKAQDEIKIAQERLRDAERPLRAAETRISTIKRELATIDGDMAKLKGEAQTAEQRIKIAQENAGQDEGPKIDPARMLPLFEKARTEFRQQPRAESLSQVQQMCTQMLGAMSATSVTKPKIAGIDCDPKTANEAASRVFALNDGIKTFGASCAGGDKLAQYKSADALFEFARKCVQDSGLASKDTDQLRQKINFIELNRDDKANRFVVTWNAFNDGNRLAYLALAIAIAIDSLIFMSGLFAANAVRSPLSDVPTSKARNAEQLEKIIDNALLPQPYTNARIAIDAMHADTSRPPYTHMIDLRELDPERQTIVRRVLGAGASIDAVHRDEREPARFFVRRELHEYLSIAGTRAFEKSGEVLKENVRDQEKLAQLEKDISVSLIPQAQPGEPPQDLNSAIAYGAQLVLDHLHPYDDPDDTGFRSELRLEEFEHAEQRKTARRALTAGSNMKLVRKAIYDVAPNQVPIEGRYVLHTDFVKVLTRLRARMLLSTGTASMQIGGGTAAAYGGSLNGGQIALGYDQAPDASQPRLAKPSEPQFRKPVQDGFRPPLSEPARPMPQPRQPNDNLSAAQIEARLHEELVVHFADQMNIDERSLRYMVDHGESMDLKGLWDGMQRALKRPELGLWPQMEEALAAYVESIDMASEETPRTLRELPGAVPFIETFEQKLKNTKHVQALLANGTYERFLEVILQEMGPDAGSLDPVRLRKYELVAQHKSELLRARTAAAWDQNIIQSLAKFQHGLASLAGTDHRPTRIS